MKATCPSAIFLAPLFLWSALAQADLAKVADFLNKGSSAPVVEIRDGSLIAVTAQSKNVPGHYIEDCRRVAIRQALLDASASGSSGIEISRKGSHRLKLTGRQAEVEDDDVGALVGLRLSSNGLAKEVTYSYLLNDPSGGTCSIVKVDAPVDGMIKRKKEEEKVAQEIFPAKYSTAEVSAIRAAAADKKGKPVSDEDIAKKSVGKLIPWECEQYSVNQAAALALQAYQAANPGVQPVLLLDYANSSVTSNITEENHKDDTIKLTSLAGHWAVRLSDVTGTKTMSAKVSFDVKEGEDSCTGVVNPIKIDGQ